MLNSGPRFQPPNDLGSRKKSAKQRLGYPRTQSYRAQEGHLPLFGFRISRAAVASCMIQCVEKDTWNRKIVGVRH
jgi:hypothetical protein